MKFSFTQCSRQIIKVVLDVSESFNISLYFTRTQILHGQRVKCTDPMFAMLDRHRLKKHFGNQKLERFNFVLQFYVKNWRHR